MKATNVLVLEQMFENTAICRDLQACKKRRTSRCGFNLTSFKSAENCKELKEIRLREMATRPVDRNLFETLHLAWLVADLHIIWEWCQPQTSVVLKLVVVVLLICLLIWRTLTKHPNDYKQQISKNETVFHYAASRKEKEFQYICHYLHVHSFLQERYIFNLHVHLSVFRYSCFISITYY